MNFPRRLAPPVVALALLVLLGSAEPAVAGEIEPRAYVNTPVDVNFLLAGYAYKDGGLAITGSSPIKDAKLTMHTGILAYARSFELLGNSGKFDAIAPYSGLSGSAMVAGQPRERNIFGVERPPFPPVVQFLRCSRAGGAGVRRLPTGPAHRRERAGVGPLRAV